MTLRCTVFAVGLAALVPATGNASAVHAQQTPAPATSDNSAELPPPGSYGFDSMKPGTTHGVKLDAALIAKLKSCTYSKSNSFGDDRPGYACKINSHIGFMAYRTQADCQAELELERANAD